MKKYFFHTCLLFFCIGYTGCAQTKPVTKQTSTGVRSNADFTFETMIPGNFVYMNVDMLDNLYLITAGNQLKKIDNNGDSVAVFNDVKKFGNPSYIDVNNPLKILVYYKSYSSVVVLDRLLTQRNTINFRRQNIFSVKAIATSYDNNIWIFDEQDLKLKKISEDGSVLLESTDMRQLVNPVPSPQMILDAGDLVYLYDEKMGFYIFDHYGALKNNLPFLNWTDIAISGNKIAGFNENKLYTYELRSLNLKTYTLPDFFKDYLAIKAVNGKVYLLKENGVDIYSIH
ncbi:MAG: hypothetical protein ABIO04_03810 [Ferruginibacter sp.]